MVRHNVTSSDALDVSVACHLGAPIVTTNTNLANAPTIGVVFVVQDVVRQSELRVLNEAAYQYISWTEWTIVKGSRALRGDGDTHS